MKRIITGILLVSATFFASAQSYRGFLDDNYSGVNSVIANPANIADSRFKLDVNLLGSSVFLGNDYYEFGDLIEKEFDFESSKSSPLENNFVAANVDIMGPSFMFNINANNSVALFTRVRGFFNLFNVNGNVLKTYLDGLDDDESFLAQEDNLSGAFNAWAEFGATYARVLLKEQQHFLKGGLSIKYLKGMGEAYAYGKNILLDYDAQASQLRTEGEFVYGRSTDFDDDIKINLKDKVSGLGVDLGFVYEWRPDYKNYYSSDKDGNVVQNNSLNKYKLKMALSVTDIGSITDKSGGGLQETYDLDRTVAKEDLEDVDFLDALKENYSVLSTNNSAKYKLPTTLHLNTDWKVLSKVYLNLNVDLPLVSKNKENAGRSLRVVSLSPRIETRWFSFYTPISLLENVGFQWGAGLRAGPLYLGSGSVLSYLLKDSPRAADVYMGLKVPIYHARVKDSDNDGIVDKLDNCPRIFGEFDNNGCPWEDTDKDGVFDKDDDCVEIPGVKENKGCPWPDTDGDGLLDKDDSCPEKPGLLENNGCPDSDGDGILDKDDACPEEFGKKEHSGCPDKDGDNVIDKEDDCPEVAGPVENNGCPVVTKEIQKQLNDYAKTILFDTGRASIKTESVGVMVDIIQILKEYSNTRFSVEGHTDSVGSSSSNQKLSELRANAVYDFLITNGISSSRLVAKGLGEEKPIATNVTRAGRKENRRVEINLIK